VKYAMLKTFCLETGDDPDYTPNTTPEKAEKDAVSVAEIQRFFESTSDQANAEKYVSFLASESNKSYLDVVVREMKNKDAFEKNLNRWKKNQ
jgi:flagellar motility protein MotE (MotC chaperone)